MNNEQLVTGVSGAILVKHYITLHLRFKVTWRHGVVALRFSGTASNRILIEGFL